MSGSRLSQWAHWPRCYTVFMTTRKLNNWRPSLPDHRDLPYAVHCPIEVAQATPDSVDLSSFEPSVFDQDIENSCAGNAGTRLYDFLQLRALRLKAPAPEEFDPTTFESSSRNFAYYNGREFEKSWFGNITDTGVTSLRDIARGYQVYGSCPESVWPYNESQVNAKPSDAAYAVAAQHKVEKVLTLDGSAAQIQACLASGFPLMCGITVFNGLMGDAAAQTGMVPLPGPNDAPRGGHAVVIIGYDRTKTFPGVAALGGYKITNSWGAAWGLEGHFWVPAAYIDDADLALADDYITMR